MTDQKHTKEPMVVGSVVPLGYFEKPSLLSSEGLEYSVAGGTVSNGEKPIDQFWMSQVKDLQIEIADLRKQRDELREACEEADKHWFDPLGKQGYACTGCDLGMTRFPTKHDDDCFIDKAHKALTKTKESV